MGSNSERRRRSPRPPGFLHLAKCLAGKEGTYGQGGGPRPGRHADPRGRAWWQVCVSTKETDGATDGTQRCGAWCSRWALCFVCVQGDTHAYTHYTTHTHAHTRTMNVLCVCTMEARAIRTGSQKISDWVTDSEWEKYIGLLGNNLYQVYEVFLIVW